MSQEQPKQPETEIKTPPTPKPTTQNSASGFQKVVQTLVQTWNQVQPIAKIQNLWTRLRPILSKIPVWWKVALTKIRSLLPLSVSQKLPNDTLLTGAIIGILIFVIWVTSIFSPDKAPQIAEVSPAPIVAPAPAELTAPVAIEAPAELTAPTAAEPVEVIAPPPPVLTPEQSLIAAIQKQVADITTQYADGLIEAIQANFQVSLLTVKVSNDWYSFDTSTQDELATDMWRRAQDLSFKKLQLTDSEGMLLARSPVVGSNMVVLKRV